MHTVEVLYVESLFDGHLMIIFLSISNPLQLIQSVEKSKNIGKYQTVLNATLKSTGGIRTLDRLSPESSQSGEGIELSIKQNRQARWLLWSVTLKTSSASNSTYYYAFSTNLNEYI